MERCIDWNSGITVTKQDTNHDVRLFEVGPRDGLQNESEILGVDQRVEMIQRLVEAGVRDVEIGSFVHPEWVPQMANTDEVARRLEPRDGTRFWALVPNPTGLERALEVGCRHVATFMSASETHNQKNVNRTISESLEDFRSVYGRALDAGCTIRAYVSTAFGCPFEGDVDFDRVLEIGETLLDYGADMIVLGDTIGAGMPPRVREGCRRALEAFGVDRLALHLHDTQGLGMANALVAYEAGVRIFDTSLGATGGCPYAPGASGNIGTEDFLHLMEGMEADVGVDLDRILETTTWLDETTDIEMSSDYYRYRSNLGEGDCSA